MRLVIASIEAEFARYKKMAEGALGQLSEEQLAQAVGGTDNPVSTIAWHISGNLRSRFTEFLSSDGEKPWRDRESEFLPRTVTHDQLMGFWELGWQALSRTLAELSDDDLSRTIKIRNQQLTVVEALHRSLAHMASHAGQIVFLAKNLCGSGWKYLSIPPGKSAEYNQNPTRERLPGAAKST